MKLLETRKLMTNHFGKNPIKGGRPPSLKKVKEILKLIILLEWA